MAIEVREVFAWVCEGRSSVAIHCLQPAGYERNSQGFRVYRDGKALFPSCLPFKTRAEAEVRAERLKVVA